VRCEAGSLIAMGCSFAGLAKSPFGESLSLMQRMHPAKFPASLELHRIKENFLQIETIM
jgi:hypothetical protein